MDSEENKTIKRIVTILRKKQKTYLCDIQNLEQKKKAFSEISQNHRRPLLKDIQTIAVVNYLETYPLVNTPVVNDIFASPFSYTTCVVLSEEKSGVVPIYKAP